MRAFLWSTNFLTLVILFIFLHISVICISKLSLLSNATPNTFTDTDTDDLITTSPIFNPKCNSTEKALQIKFCISYILNAFVIFFRLENNFVNYGNIEWKEKNSCLWVEFIIFITWYRWRDVVKMNILYLIPPHIQCNREFGFDGLRYLRWLGKLTYDTPFHLKIHLALNKSLFLIM